MSTNTDGPSRPHKLSEIEYKSVLNAADTPRDKLLVFLLWHTGMRSMEVAGFRKAWFHEEDNVVTIPADSNKSMQPREIPLSEEIARELQGYVEDFDEDGLDMTVASVAYRVRELGRRVGIENLNPMAFRRAAVNRLRNGKSSRDSLRQSSNEPTGRNSETTILLANTSLKTGIDIDNISLIMSIEKFDQLASEYLNSLEGSRAQPTLMNIELVLNSFRNWISTQATGVERIDLFLMLRGYLQSLVHRSSANSFAHKVSILWGFIDWIFEREFE